MPEEFELDQQLIDDYADSAMSATAAQFARINALAAEFDPQAAAYDDKIRKQNPVHKNHFVKTSKKVVWVTSLKNPSKGIRAGRVFCCPPLLAATIIVGSTHRLSSEEEISSWHKEQGIRVEATKELEAAKHPQAPVAPIHVVLGPDAVDAIRSAGAPKHSQVPSPAVEQKNQK